jgi:predicted nucleic-acid-binding Zn-ribbon protein
MGRRSAVLVTINRLPFRCQVCQAEHFFDREVKLNTTGAEFLDLGWANQSATGLVCARCGYVHLFLNNTIEFWRAEGGYPQR